MEAYKLIILGITVFLQINNINYLPVIYTNNYTYAQIKSILLEIYPNLLSSQAIVPTITNIIE